ncbi:MAG: hypothetical protein QXJ75_00060 [Candidatus Bathyarchaeia archaeon]
MRISQLLVTRFFQLTFNRDFAAAERILYKLKENPPGSMWFKGYITALEGVLLAYRGRNDRYAFINRLETDKENIARLQREFQDKARDLLFSEFDRGFFSAWFDLMGFIGRNGLQNMQGDRAERGLSVQETDSSTT